MSELTGLVRALRALANDAEALAVDLAAPIAPRTELCDLLEREFRLDISSVAARLLLDAAAEEITRLVLAPYMDAAADLAHGLRDLVGDDEDEVNEAAFLCLDCGVDTAEIGEYYMVTGEVWGQAAEPDDGMLCVGCLEERLGRRLEPGDFTDTPVNHREGSARLRSRVLGLEEAPAG